MGSLYRRIPLRPAISTLSGLCEMFSLLNIVKTSVTSGKTWFIAYTILTEKTVEP